VLVRDVAQELRRWAAAIAAMAAGRGGGGEDLDRAALRWAAPRSHHQLSTGVRGGDLDRDRAGRTSPRSAGDRRLASVVAGAPPIPRCACADDIR